MKGGDLKSFIEKRKLDVKPITDTECQQIMTCILSAIQYMHNTGVIHRDIKPGNIHQMIQLRTHMKSESICDIVENILLKDMESVDKVKIADFGLST
jgi:serine/threonine protein kinase